MNKVEKDFNKALNEISDSAEESLINTIINKGGDIQLTPEQTQEYTFYSSCNGAVPYLVARLCADGTLYCPEEGETWGEEDVLSDDEDSEVEIAAIMQLNEMDLLSLCKLSDFINANFGSGATEYAQQYESVVADAKEKFSTLKLPLDMSANSDRLNRVTFIDEDTDDIVSTTRPMILWNDYYINDDWKKVEYTQVPTDDFAILVDDLIAHEIL